jgi:hypothetical protein
MERGKRERGKGFSKGVMVVAVEARGGYEQSRIGVTIGELWCYGGEGGSEEGSSLEGSTGNCVPWATREP